MKSILPNPRSPVEAEAQLEALATEAHRRAERCRAEADAAIDAAALLLEDFHRLEDLATLAGREAAALRERRQRRAQAERARDVRRIGFEAATLKRSA